MRIKGIEERISKLSLAKKTEFHSWLSTNSMIDISDLHDSKKYPSPKSGLLEMS